MKTEYLFNTSGRWIAFKIGNYLFNTDCAWIGWFPFANGIAVDTEGIYLGTIFLKDRLLVDLKQQVFPYPGYPGYPSYPGYSGYPGYRGFCDYIPNTADIKEERLRASCIIQA